LSALLSAAPRQLRSCEPSPSAAELPLKHGAPFLDKYKLHLKQFFCRHSIAFVDESQPGAPLRTLVSYDPATQTYPYAVSEYQQLRLVIHSLAELSGAQRHRDIIPAHAWAACAALLVGANGLRFFARTRCTEKDCYICNDDNLQVVRQKMEQVHPHILLPGMRANALRWLKYSFFLRPPDP